MSQDLPVPLPPISPSDQAWLTHGPDTDAAVAFVQAYARACMTPLQEQLIEAEKVCDSYAAENQRLFDRAESAEAELSRLKAQKPSAWVDQATLDWMPDTGYVTGPLCKRPSDRCTTPLYAAAPSTPQPAPAIPRPGSPEASAMIDSVLDEYNWPSNPKNAARAGFEAARRMLATPPPDTVQVPK